MRAGYTLEERAAWLAEGALLDIGGHLLACVEFPLITGLPDNFYLPEAQPTDLDYVDRAEPEAAGRLTEDAMPAPGGSWSEADLLAYLRRR